MTAEKAQKLGEPVETAEEDLTRLTRLLDFLAHDSEEKPGNATTRGHAIRSALAIALRRDVKASAAPAYARLVLVLKAERAAPRMGESSEVDDRCFLRAYALESLGRLNDPALAALMVDAVGASEGREDRIRRLDVAAQGAIIPLMPAVLTSPELRTRLLARLTEGGWRGGDAAETALKDVERLAKVLFGALRSLSLQTELLESYLKASPGEKAEMDALARGWELLRDALDEGRPVPREVFLANVESLLRFSRSAREPVARRARAIVLEVAPYALFREMAAKAASAPRESRADLEKLARLLPQMAAMAAAPGEPRAGTAAVLRDGRARLDEGPELQRLPFAEARAQVLRSIFEFLAAGESERRELLYSELLGAEPVELARFLVARERQALAEGEAEAAQHARLLGNLAGEPPVVSDKALRAKVLASLANLSAYPSKESRALVSGYLLEKETGALARGLAPVVERLDTLAPEQAEDVLSLAIACASRLKEPPAKADALMAGRLIAKGFARSEPRPREAALRYLFERDHAFATQALAAQVLALAPRKAGVDLHLLSLLCDAVVSKKEALPPAVKDAGVNALAAALKNLDEERALHVARAIAESGHAQAKEVLTAYAASEACAWPAVKTLIEAETR